MALDLNKKIGPLSVKMWGIVGAGTFGLVWYATRGRPDNANAEEVSDPLDVSEPFPADGGGTFFPMSTGASGGSYDGMDPAYADSLAPIADALVGLGGQLEDVQGQLGSIEELVTPPEVIEPPEEAPNGGSTPDFGARLARLRARRQALKARAQEADPGTKQRQKIHARIVKTQKTIKQVRRERAQARRR
jgi:hypothetical protein